MSVYIEVPPSFAHVYPEVNRRDVQAPEKASGPRLAGDANPGMDYEDRIVIIFLRAVGSLRWAVLSGPNKTRCLVAPKKEPAGLLCVCMHVYAPS